ncbi:MAG: hypothetical protein E6274_06405 [Clostridium sp.]|uniref:hypothetical protein n=1 Tax=Clostridium sp. TaxID=1506 RepID=UPI00290F52D9|nr:hypothetical protein [Clostridium sp.]MDU7251949.1 hypothetical protein [Clostridium sp.]
MEAKQSIDIIASIGAVISLFSAIFAFAQARSAKKSYKLQKEIFEAGKVNYKLQEIENSFLVNSKNDDKIYYFFKIVLANLSDRSTSINKVSLEILHDSNVSFIIDCIDSVTIYSDLPRLTFPNNIDPHNSNSGWIVFKIERKIYDTININTHFIVVEDIHGIIVKKEEIYVREEFIGYDF